MITKTGVLLQTVALVSIMSATAGAQEPNDRRYQAANVRPEDQYIERYVTVTGSLIPRKIKVRKNGVTNSPDNLRIYSQQELERSGRITPAEQLATIDPSISIRRH